MPYLKTTRLLAVAVACAVPATLAAQERTTLGGYGEIHYSNASGPNTPAQVNVKRFVVFLGHTFSDRLAFRSEIEIEDAKLEGGTPGGELALEQAYLDYRLGATTTLRSGLVLVPIGIINETHEPPTFNGVARPTYARLVIPATWREIGAGLAGRLPWPGVSYRAYLLSGLQASGFTAGSGVRGGRQEGAEASFANPSLTGRLEYARPGLKVGGAFWYGGTTGGDTLVGAGAFAAPVSVLAADLRWDRGAFAVRAEAATIGLRDAGRINAVYGDSVGSRIAGGYLEGAVNLVKLLAPASSQRLNLFVRHERYDTHASVPGGITRNDANARRVTAFGLTWLPEPQVAFKADYLLRRNRAGVGEDEVLSLGIGYWF